MRYLLKTSRLVLCPIGPRFFDSTHAYAIDREITRYMLHLPNDSAEETMGYLAGALAEWLKERPRFYEFAILLEGRHIGACSIYLDENGLEGELGWLIVKDCWRRGYAFEAASAVVRYAVDELGVKKFKATCDSENIGSRRVMEKLGMEQVSCTGGRRNKSADCDSFELLYAADAIAVKPETGEGTAIIRTMMPEEYPLLNDFLYEAIFIPEGVEPPPREIINDPALQVYVANFGGKHDNALLAFVDGRPAGAVWTRIMNDYGHVDDNTPSFAISLYEPYRGKGIGRVLMEEMLRLLSEKDYEKASLAVQKANYAVKLYRNVGFEVTGENDEEYIMVCRLNGESAK